MLMSGVFAYFLKVKIPEVVMGGFGALLFSVFLIYDTQRIVGGGATQLDDRDYVLGAMDLYLVGGRGREGGREGTFGDRMHAALSIKFALTSPPSLPPSLFLHHRTSRVFSSTCFGSWPVRTGGSSKGEARQDKGKATTEKGEGKRRLFKYYYWEMMTNKVKSSKSKRMHTRTERGEENTPEKQQASNMCSFNMVRFLINFVKAPPGTDY